MTISKDHLKNIRLCHGLTQTQFAEILHCKLRAMQNYESGFSILPPDKEELLFLKMEKGLSNYAKRK